MVSMRAALLIAAAVSFPSASLAVDRTTPVEVKNVPTVGISDAANDVKAQQSGPWGVNILNAPNVNAAQSGAWSVGISPLANTVKEPPQTAMVRLWPSDRVMPANTSVTSDLVPCDGYRQIRGVLTSTSSSTSLVVQLRFIGPGGQHTTIGQSTFGGVNTGLVDGSSFVKAGYTCTFSVPVLSPTFQLNVINQSPDQVTLYSGNCWVYLTN